MKDYLQELPVIQYSESRSGDGKMKKKLQRIKEHLEDFFKRGERGTSLIDFVVGTIVVAIAVYILIVLIRYLIIPALLGH
jgi:hypothetical protein